MLQHGRRGATDKPAHVACRRGGTTLDAIAAALTVTALDRRGHTEWPFCAGAEGDTA